MKACCWLLFGLLILLCGRVHAEGGCPPGMIPAGGTDINSCVPIPPGYYNNQQQAQPQLPLPPPPAQWASQWGAIATDKVKGIIGAVTGLSSKSEAQQAAMANCQAKGGSPCKFEIAYDNECAVLVVGDNGYNVSADVTLDKAVQFGMKICTDAKNTNCHVYYSACSLPERVQ